MMKSVKGRRANRTDTRSALNQRLIKIQADLTKLRRDREGARRDEFAELTKALRQIDRNTATLAVQFTRMSNIQAELDAIKRVLVRAKLWE